MKKSGIVALIIGAVAVFAGAVLRLEGNSYNKPLAILGIVASLIGIALLVAGILREKISDA